MTGRQHAIIGTTCGAVVGYVLTSTSNMSTLNTSMTIVQTIFGSLIGALIVDIDAKHSKASQAFAKIGIALIWFIVGLKVFNLDSIDTYYKMFQTNTLSTVSIMAFALLITIGKLSPHRQFTHKVFGATLFCIMAYIIFVKPMAIGFVIGYISHILADKTTKAGLKFFDFKLPMQNRRGKFEIHF